MGFEQFSAHKYINPVHLNTPAEISKIFFLPPLQLFHCPLAHTPPPLQPPTPTPTLPHPFISPPPYNSGLKHNPRKYIITCYVFCHLLMTGKFFILVILVFLFDGCIQLILFELQGSTNFIRISN